MDGLPGYRDDLGFFRQHIWWLVALWAVLMVSTGLWRRRGRPAVMQAAGIVGLFGAAMMFEGFPRTRSVPRQIWHWYLLACGAAIALGAFLLYCRYDDATKARRRRGDDR